MKQVNSILGVVFITLSIFGVASYAESGISGSKQYNPDIKALKTTKPAPKLVPVPNIKPTPNPRLLKRTQPGHSWDIRLPSNIRFSRIELGFLDKETGLVWDRLYDISNWGDAFWACADHTRAGRKGWHLPSISQLTSLWYEDNTTKGFYGLVPDVKDCYWSSTVAPNRSTNITSISNSAFAVKIHNQDATPLRKNTPCMVMCVRGGIEQAGM